MTTALRGAAASDGTEAASAGADEALPSLESFLADGEAEATDEDMGMGTSTITPRLRLFPARNSVHGEVLKEFINYEGHYGMLVNYLRECKEDPTDPIPQEKFEGLLAAVEALSRDGVGQTVTLRPGSSGEGFLKNIGVAITKEAKEEKKNKEDHENEEQMDTVWRYSSHRPLKITEVECAQILNTPAFDAHVFVSGCRAAGDDKDLDVLTYMFQAPYDLIGRYNIDTYKMGKCIKAIRSKYLAKPYHNWAHAVGVTQFCHHAVSNGGAGSYINFQDMLVVYMAAIAHDVGHPGLETSFLVRTQHDLAIQYNDRSPLENMHSYTFFETMRLPEHNFLPERFNFQTFRKKTIAAILGTDMSSHFPFMDRMSARMAIVRSNPFMVDTKDDKSKKEASKDDRRMILDAFLKTADLVQNARPFECHMMGVLFLEEEWFLQGDQERSLGLPITDNHDRHKDSAASCQAFFLPILVQPLISLFGELCSAELREFMLDNLSRNKEMWGVVIATYGLKAVTDLMPLIRAGLTNGELNQKLEAQVSQAKATAAESAAPSS